MGTPATIPSASVAPSAGNSNDSQTPQDPPVQRPWIIPPNLQSALKDLRNAFLREQQMEEFAVIQKTAKSRDIYANKQTGWFSQQLMQWQPYNTAPGYNKDTAPLYTHNLGIHQAVGLILVSAVASTGVPGTKFVPADPNNEHDIAWAEQATKVKDLIDTMTDPFPMWTDLWKLFYTDGPVIGYSRWVETKAAVPAVNRFICPNCQSQSDENPMLCPECQAPMGGIEPTEIEKEQPAQGELRRDIYGLLESRLPNYAKTVEDCPYIGIETDLHVSSAKAYAKEVNPDIVPKIKGGQVSGGAEIVPMAQARQLADSATGFNNYRSFQYGSPVKDALAIYRRWWFSPDAFMAETIKEEKDRGELQQMFPDGCRVEWINDEFCAAYPDQMKRSLVIGRPLPGDGMFTPSMGENVVPVHEAANDAFNLRMEAMEYASFPPVIVNASLLTRDSFSNRMRPRDLKFVKLRGGQRLDDAMKQMVVKEASTTVQQMLEEWGGLVEFLAGSQPSLFGASQENIRTTSGYQTARNQALQRLGVPFQNSKKFLAAFDAISVQQYMEHAPKQQTYSFLGASPEGYLPASINLDLEEGKFVAYPESSETIPATWAQRQAAIDQLLESQNELVKAIIADPANLEWVSQEKAIPGLTVPGRDARNKMLALIDAMLSAQNVPQDPSTQQELPMFQPNPVMDDLGIFVKTIQEWSASPAGQAAEISNPQGYQRISLFAEQAQQLAIPQPPPPEPKDIIVPAGASVIEQSTQTVVFPKPGTPEAALAQAKSQQATQIKSSGSTPAGESPEGGESNPESGAQGAIQ